VLDVRGRDRVRRDPAGARHRRRPHRDLEPETVELALWCAADPEGGLLREVSTSDGIDAIWPPLQRAAEDRRARRAIDPPAP